MAFLLFKLILSHPPSDHPAEDGEIWVATHMQRSPDTRPQLYLNVSTGCVTSYMTSRPSGVWRWVDMAPVPTLIAILRRRTSEMGHKAVDSNMWQTKFPLEFFSPSKSSGCYILQNPFRISRFCAFQDRCGGPGVQFRRRLGRHDGVSSNVLLRR